MFKSWATKTLAVVLISLSAAATNFADTKIRFARGRSSATVAGKIGRGGRVCYSAYAKAGQTLTAAISSKGGDVQIFESGATSYTYEIETTGEQSICADNLSGAATYKLTVSIN